MKKSIIRIFVVALCVIWSASSFAYMVSAEEVKSVETSILDSTTPIYETDVSQEEYSISEYEGVIVSPKSAPGEPDGNGDFF